MYYLRKVIPPDCIASWVGHWQRRRIGKVKKSIPARNRIIHRSPSLATLPTELYPGPNLVQYQPKETSLDNPQPRPPPPNKQKVRNHKIIQQSPGHSRNCFTLNHEPVNHHIPSQQSRLTIVHLQAIIRDFRLDRQTATFHSASYFQKGFWFESLQPDIAQTFLGHARIESIHGNISRRQVCHSVIRDARMSGWCKTLRSSWSDI